MNPHVDEKLVSRVERAVTPGATGPEAGEILRPPLIHVTALNVPH